MAATDGGRSVSAARQRRIVLRHVDFLRTRADPRLPPALAGVGSCCLLRFSRRLQPLRPREAREPPVDVSHDGLSAGRRSDRLEHIVDPPGGAVDIDRSAPLVGRRGGRRHNADRCALTHPRAPHGGGGDQPDRRAGISLAGDGGVDDLLCGPAAVLSCVHGAAPQLEPVAQDLSVLRRLRRRRLRRLLDCHLDGGRRLDLRLECDLRAHVPAGHRH